MKYLKLISVILILVFASCRAGKVPFTTDIKKQYALSDNSLKKMQFYTSDEIVLYQIKEEGDASIKDGKLFLLNEKNCEKIIIKKNTPCVLEQVIDDHKLILSFENGENRYIAFGNVYNGSYSLLAKEWENEIGTIEYADKIYATNNGNVYLKVVLKKLNKLKSRERTVKGRKV